jgi:SEC-C motif-containing protein
MQCPCGSNSSYDLCCGRYISGAETPPTAEALMRSRYTAYTQANIAYIAQTLAPESRRTFDGPAAKSWATQAQWLGLKIRATEKGGVADATGVVDFVASCKLNGETIGHHEVSHFRKTDEGQWLFVSDDTHARDESGQQPGGVQTFVREAPKVGRNDPCPCGSGKKYKKCCAT